MVEYRLLMDKHIIDLEKNLMFNSAARFVYQNWKKDRMNTNLILCAGAQLWHTRLMVEYYRNHPNPPDTIEQTDVGQLDFMLMEVTRWGLKYFADSAIFNAYFGYMIKVMPHYFMDYKGNYSEWQDKGVSMIKRAFELDPKNLFVKAMFYESDNYSLFYETCESIWKQFTPYDWGTSDVQQYFFHILCGDAICDVGDISVC